MGTFNGKRVGPRSKINIEILEVCIGDAICHSQASQLGERKQSRFARCLVGRIRRRTRVENVEDVVNARVPVNGQ